MDTKELAALLLFLFSIAAAIFVKNYGGVYARFPNGAQVKVEIVSDPTEISTGLMFRKNIGENEGMLFSYSYDGYYTIWMKNMNFPIDIIWLSSDLKVVDIKMSAEPCRQEPCEVYQPAKPARYVLEVSANFTMGNKVVIGDEVVIEESFP
ncbi:MAG: DUF192 domain-containing protein [Candidatus Hydrothermarchaeales archaeon]